MKLRRNGGKIEIKSLSAHSQCSAAGTKHHTESTPLFLHIQLSFCIPWMEEGSKSKEAMSANAQPLAFFTTHLSPSALL